MTTPGMTQTVQMPAMGTNPTATLLVPAGSGPMLVYNNGPNTVWLGDTNAIIPTDIRVIPLTNGSMVNVTGDRDLFGVVAINAPTTVFVLAGGLNFFAPLKAFAAGDTIINTQGIFIYEGTPALGNLKFSIAATAGVDQFGNVYTDNAAAYNVAVAGGGYAQMASNPTTGLPFFILAPPSMVHEAAYPQINSAAINPGAANESAQLITQSGYETIPGAAGAAYAQYISRPNNGGVGSSFAQLVGDNIRAVRPDGNSYPVGQIVASAAPNQTINTTAAHTLTGTTLPVTAGSYDIKIMMQFIGNQAAGNPSIQVGISAPVSYQWGNALFWDAGSGVNRYDVNTGGMLFGGPVMSTNAWYFSADCYATFTGSGAVSLQAWTNVAADTYIIAAAKLTLTPQF